VLPADSDAAGQPAEGALPDGDHGDDPGPGPHRLGYPR
jgi:hypothetical protein